jgi:hypothetical protein
MLWGMLHDILLAKQQFSDAICYSCFFFFNIPFELTFLDFKNYLKAKNKNNNV